MRLDKFLSNENIGSRKAVGTLVRSGAVAVNGQAVRKSDIRIDPEKDEITVNGKPVRYSAFVYIMLYKPSGVLTATRDSRAETVLDLLPPELKRRDLFPAGRLDKDTTGLLVLTNDGEYAHRMLAPKSHVWKRYRATLGLPAEESDIARFAAGIKAAKMSSPLPCSKSVRTILTSRGRKFGRGSSIRSSVCFQRAARPSRPFTANLSAL